MYKRSYIFLYSAYLFLLFPFTICHATNLVLPLANSTFSHSYKGTKVYLYSQGSYFKSIDTSYANKIGIIGFGGKGKYKRLQFQQELFYSTYEKIIYLKAQELFLNYKPWFIGQKKHLWSWADLLWNNNLWQAEFYQNPVQAVSMGLLGLHWQKEYKKWSYYIFFSPVFLPRYSSHLSITSNTIQSFTPWRQSAPVRFNDLPILYKLNDFSASQLLTKHSIALQLNYKLPLSFFVRSAFAYKPSNAIYLGLKPVASAKALNVNIKPYTVQESLATVEGGVKNPSWSLLLSATHRSFKNSKDTEAGYFFDKLSNVFLYNLYYSINNNNNYSVFTSYQKVLGYTAKSYSQYIQLKENLFSYPYNYLDAVTLGFKIVNLFNIFGVDYNLRATYDFKQQASILVSHLLWRPKPEIEILFNVTNFYKNKSVAYNSNYFLHRFAKNHFIQMGVKYVF
ncbi:MAG: hypothetical protein HAW63_00545 [Bdellovibrionaceae bacterium]|nr:hypothetical protein [Pseudobdellovibrionaceae bacterium]